MPEPSVLHEPEGLVIEILTDQMIDLNESSTDVLEIFAVMGGEQKGVEVHERKMTDEDRRLILSQSEGGRVAVVAGSQSVRRCEHQGC